MAHENLSDLSDADLFRGWRGGDKNMGKLFYRRHANTILRYFRRNVFDTSKIEELTQETFFEAMQPSTVEIQNARAYLFGIAAHVFSRHIRQRRKETGRPEWQDEEIEDSLHSLDPNLDPEYFRQQRDEDRLLMKAMRRLPFNQQVVLELSYWEQMAGREIADALRIPEGTVRGRLRLGKKALGELIEQLQESPEQFRTATLSFTSWQRQVHDYMTGLDPDWDKGGDVRA